jgi:hypothetical protein
MLELLANLSSSQKFGLVGMCRETEIETDRKRQTDTQEELGDSSGVCALLDEGAWECYQHILSSKLERVILLS